MTHSEPPADWDGVHKSVAEVLAVWPEAQWMPWDVPPIGQMVTFAGDLVGKVIGAEPLETAADHDCPCCTCKEPNPVRRHWHVRVDDWRTEYLDGGNYVKGGRGRPMVVITYPPRLRRLEP